MNLGTADLNRANGESGTPVGVVLFNYIASVIATQDADIACLQEITNSAAAKTCPLILAALNAPFPANAPQWQFSYIKGCQNLNDGYAFFYRGNPNLQLQEIPADQTPNLNPINSNPQNRNLIGIYPNLPTSTGGRGGRGAAYVLVTNPETQHIYLVMTYHAPSKPPGNTGALEQMTAIWQDAINGGNQFQPPLKFQPPLPPVVNGLIICGDFNVDYITDEELYQNLAPALNTGLQSVPTSLANFGCPEPNSTQCGATQADVFDVFGVKAYDNFLYSAVPTENTLGGGVVDCISLNLQPLPAGLVLAPTLFFAGIWQTATVLPLYQAPTPGPPYPPGYTPTYQSFVAYRYVVSDHLPVIQEFDL